MNLAIPSPSLAVGATAKSAYNLELLSQSLRRFTTLKFPEPQ